MNLKHNWKLKKKKDNMSTNDLVLLKDINIHLYRSQLHAIKKKKKKIKGFS